MTPTELAGRLGVPTVPLSLRAAQGLQGSSMEKGAQRRLRLSWGLGDSAARLPAVSHWRRRPSHKAHLSTHHPPNRSPPAGSWPRAQGMVRCVLPRAQTFLSPQPQQIIEPWRCLDPDTFRNNTVNAFLTFICSFLLSPILTLELSWQNQALNCVLYVIFLKGR